MAHVVVRNVAGDELELFLDRQCTVRSLQQQIQDRWHVPTACQRLILGCKILEASESLVSLVGEKSASVTLVVSCDGVLEQLQDSGSFEVRLGAVATLNRIVPKGRADDSVVAALCDRSGDPHARVRLAVLGALADLAEKGCEGALAAAGKLLSDTNAHVRAAAVKALGALAAGRGDAKAVAAASSRLAHSIPEVRGSAVEALAKVAGVGDSEAVERLCQRVTDENARVRRAAVSALGQVSAQGDSAAVATVAGCLKDDADSEVRAVACATLEALATSGDAMALQAAGICLEDKAAEVRRAGVKLLAHLAKEARGAALAEVYPRLKHGAAGVRIAALVALKQMSTNDDRLAIRAMCDCLKDEDTRVRLTGVKLLGQSMGPDSEMAISAVLAQLSDPSPEVRCEVLAAAVRVLTVGNERVARAIADLLEDENAAVREIAAHLSAKVTEMQEGGSGTPAPAAAASQALGAARRPQLVRRLNAGLPRTLSSRARWRVVGGAEQGGILVREGESLASRQLSERLCHGSIVEEAKLAGDRLFFCRRLSGSGPDCGWVSVRLRNKELLVRLQLSE